MEINASPGRLDLSDTLVREVIKQEIKRMAYEDMCETNLQASSNLKENDNDNAKAAD